MKLFIPPIGSRLRLLDDWGFDLRHNYRNEAAFIAFGLVMKPMWGNPKPDPEKVGLREGTLLEITKVEIQRNWQSISFRLLESPDPKIIDNVARGKACLANRWNTVHIPSVRFRASLENVNRMEFEIEPTPPKKTRKV